MIVRTWRCRAMVAQAEAYQAYLINTIFHRLKAIDGHRGAYLLRRELTGDRAGQIEFQAVTFWDSVAAIKEYSGEQIDRAVVQPEAKALLADFDEHVEHYQIAYDTMTQGQ